ncbi:MAG: DUF1559 domain-containing protein [Gemmataceae bacterium]|nr:DUF1559 domain-containing protein [Gemmataceae bacterium]
MAIRTPRRAGLSLIELLVVIAIIAVLIALTIPAVQRVRAAADRAACANNMKQLGLALHGHHTVKGQFPQGTMNDSLPWGPKRVTWAVWLYPYLEQGNAFKHFDINQAPYWNAVWYNNANSKGANAPTATRVPSFLCPADRDGIVVRRVTYPDYGYHGDFIAANYLAFFGGLNYGGAMPGVLQPGQRGVFGLNYGARLADVTDGTSHTLALGEYLRALPNYEFDFRGSIWSDQPGYSQLYTQNTPNTSSPDLFYWDWLAVYANHRPDLNRPASRSVPGSTDTAASRSMHWGGVNVLFCDGSVRFVHNTIDVKTWRALGTMAGGETAQGDF